MKIFKKYVLAVSGGPDSMAMLDMYKKKALAVCTVDYNKRSDSKNDVSIVRNYCKKNNIPFFLYEVSDKFYENNKNQNFQNLARQIRYDFFAKICSELNNNNLLVAHNFNDFLETAYMQFQKKSKALFYGIKQRNNFKNLKIYRPLLRFKKTTLERYCIEHNIQYAIDSTNDSNFYLRNRIRKIINNWSQQEVIDFKRQIINYNKKNRKIEKKLTSYFKKWKKINFDLFFINDLIRKDKLEAYYLLFNFLKLNNELNINQNKINNLKKFLISSSHNKKFRLEERRYLLINNGKLIIQKN